MGSPSDFSPSEEAIESLLARFTPRQLAIGYLRAQRRARTSDLAFRTLDDITTAKDAIRDGGSFEDIIAPLDRAKRRFNREF